MMIITIIIMMIMMMMMMIIIIIIINKIKIEEEKKHIFQPQTIRFHPPRPIDVSPCCIVEQSVTYRTYERTQFHLILVLDF